MSDPAIRRVTAVFDDWARAGRADGMERSHGPAARRAFARLELPDRPFRYLDVGCGSGYTVRWAADRLAALGGGGLAVGLDGSAEMIARSEALRGDRTATFLHADFPAHGASDVLVEGSFDAVFSMEVAYYLPDLHAGLTEVARLLRPGGRFACTVDFYGENPDSHSWPEELGVPMTLLGRAGWRAAFEAAGLAVVEQAQLRAPPGTAGGGWKESVGSLLTVGVRSGGGAEVPPAQA